MPVFLDRHDFFKVKTEDIGHVLIEDLKIQQRFRCCVLAYWFDQKRKTTFCLINAPDLESVKELHCHVHKTHSRQIIQIEEDLIAEFLDNFSSPKLSSSKYAPKSPTFLKQNYSAVMVMKISCADPFLTKDCTKGNRMFDDFMDCLQKLIRKNKGRILNSSPDGYIYFFDSISQSLKCAIQIQNLFEIKIKITEIKKIILRIGIDARRGIKDNYGLFEDTTNLARRLCYIGNNNQIMVSSRVIEQCRMQDLGSFKNNSYLKSLSSKNELFLTRLMEIIEVHYREDLKIGDFCKLLGESRSQLYRKIIEVTNLSPLALINEFRLSRATDLMQMKSDNNISQIAYEAGFNSLSYFSRRFKKRYGILPSTYLKNGTI